MGMSVGWDVRMKVGGKRHIDCPVYLINEVALDVKRKSMIHSAQNKSNMDAYLWIFDPTKLKNTKYASL